METTTPIPIEKPRKGRRSYNMDFILGITMPILLVLAFGWDRLAFTLQVRQADAFGMQPVTIWILPLGSLVQAAALLVLAWLVAFSPVRRIGVSILYLAAGLLITFSPAASDSGLPLPRIFVAFLTYDARLTLTAGLIAVIGLAGLVWPKEAPGRDKRPARSLEPVPEEHPAADGTRSQS
jgi:hypothetical protein